MGAAIMRCGRPCCLLWKGNQLCWYADFQVLQVNHLL